MTSTIPAGLAIATDALRRLAHPDNPIHTIDATTKSSTNERAVILELARGTMEGAAPTMSELGARVGMSRAAITALVDRMERAGAIVRRPDPEDRRRIYLDVPREVVALVEEAIEWQPARPAAVAAREASDRAAAQRFEARA